jgi:hypothetical protein
LEDPQGQPPQRRDPFSNLQPCLCMAAMTSAQQIFIGLKSFLVENLCRKLKGFGRQPVVIWYDFGMPITYLLQLHLDFGHWRFPTSKAKQLGINRAANPKWGSGLQRERRCISAFLAVFWRLHGYIV